MKVVHISSGDSGGAGIAAKRLNRALNDADVESKLLCLHKTSKDETVIKFNVPIYNKLLIHSHLPIGQNKYLNSITEIDRVYEVVSFPEALFDISEHPLVKDADIVNLHWVGNILNYKKFFSKIKQPIVWTLHDMNPFLGIAHYMGDYNKNITYRKLEDKVAQIKYQAISNHRNLQIVNLCNWMKQYSMNSIVFKDRHHSIVPNSIDTKVFNLRNKEACRRALGIPSDVRVVLFCAQAIGNQRKGFDLLLGALKKINQKCLLTTVGSTKGLNLPNGMNCKHFGTVRDELTMSIIYSASDLFLLPSREDNLPNTMVESLCCGTPVISYSNGGMRDVVKNKQSGILVDEQTSDAFADAINQALCSLSDYDSQKIASKYSKMFDPTKQANEYISIYKSLILKV